jgi:hypothetical protein
VRVVPATGESEQVLEQEQQAQWERWTEENAGQHDTEYLQFQRNLAEASIKAGECPSLNPNWRQDVQDLDQIIANRQQACSAE